MRVRACLEGGDFGFVLLLASFSTSLVNSGDDDGDDDKENGAKGIFNSPPSIQCRCGFPVPHIPHDLGTAEHDGASPPAPAEEEANTDNFLASFVEPQRGHFVPCQSVDRTRISLSCSHFAQ